VQTSTAQTALTPVIKAFVVVGAAKLLPMAAIILIPFLSTSFEVKEKDINLTIIDNSRGENTNTVLSISIL